MSTRSVVPATNAVRAEAESANVELAESAELDSNGMCGFP